MLASQLQHHLTWTPAGLAAELAAARDRLGLMVAENLSVAAAFGLSYGDLTEDQQRLFRLWACTEGQTSTPTRPPRWMTPPRARLAVAWKASTTST